MPLSVSGRPDQDQAEAVIRRALDLGINLFDTADVYCLGETELGHNERLISQTLRKFAVGRDVHVATKAGMTRTGGSWGRDGRPSHIRAACEASLSALGVETIELYQFHAPDPEVDFSESVGAFARLREEGKVRNVGLSNVTMDELVIASEIVPITSVQNRFNPWDLSSEKSGLLAHCDREGITFIPYSPVGGGRRVHLIRGDKQLFALGKELGVSPEQLVIAWILSRSNTLVLIPGARRVESVEGSVKAGGLSLSEEVLGRIGAAFDGLAD